MPKQGKEQSVIITSGQARAVLALQFEREEILRRANERVGEIMAGFQEQGRLLAMVHELPRGESWRYNFESVDVDGERRVKLTAVPAEMPEDVGAAEPAEGQEGGSD